MCTTSHTPEVLLGHTHVQMQVVLVLYMLAVNPVWAELLTRWHCLQGHTALFFASERGASDLQQLLLLSEARSATVAERVSRWW